MLLFTYLLMGNVRHISNSISSSSNSTRYTYTQAFATDYIYDTVGAESEPAALKITIFMNGRYVIQFCI